MARVLFIWVTMVLCYGLGCLMVCVDLASVPVIDHDYARSHPDWRVTDRYYDERSWELRPGDGVVSALESCLLWLGLLFGFMRTIDLLRAYHDEDHMNRWTYFWGLSE